MEKAAADSQQEKPSSTSPLTSSTMEKAAANSQQEKSSATSPVSSLKRPRELQPPSLSCPKFDSMKILRLIHGNNEDANSPARKVRKVDLPKPKPEECLIKIKQEKDLLESSSDGYSTITSESSYARSNSRSPKWNAFGSSVLFTSTPSRTNRRPSSSSPCHTSIPFCFNCKRFGHLRQTCNCSWNYWWPQEILNEYPWIHRKLAQLRVIRRNRNFNYKHAAVQLDREVEMADRKKKMNANATQNRYGRPWYAATPPRSPAPAGKILFKTAPRTLIMENIQNAINELQQSLSKLRDQCNTQV